MGDHAQPRARCHATISAVARRNEIKGSTARSANQVLDRTGKPFWQYETYDHCVHNKDELNKVIRYIERNPVRAGLAHDIEDWRWSSAGAGQRPALQQVR
jgi:REP element-mobilizing transposase RayT